MKKITEKDDMRSFLQDTFSNFEVNADTEVWQHIQTKLDKKERKVIPLWWTYGAAASALLLFGVTLFWNSTTSTDTTYQPLASELTLESTIEIPVEEPALVEATDIDYNSATQTEKNYTSPKIEKQAGFPTNTTSTKTRKNEFIAATDEAITQEKEATFPLDTESTPVHTATTTLSTPTLNAPSGQHINKNTTAEITTALSENTPTREPTKESTATPQDQFASVQSVDSIDNSKPIAGSGVTTNKNTESDLDSLAAVAALQIDLGMPVEDEKEFNKQWMLAANLQSSRDNSEQIINYGLVNDEGFKDVEYTNLATVAERDRPNTTFEERSYLPPLKVSVTVNYRFQPKWSLETGLSYAVLASTRNSTETSAFNIEQRDFLYYLGIPMLINYEWYTRTKFAAFLTSGLMIEKGLTHVSKIIIEENEGFNETSRAHINGIKYSAFLGLGAEYRPYSLIGIYLQPGITSYASTSPQPFDIGGSNSTGVKPELRFGLRFHLN